MVLGFEENTSAILLKFRNQREPVWRNRFSDTDQVKALKYYLDGTEPDEEQAYDPDEEDVRRLSTDDLELCFEEKSDALQSAEEALRMLTVSNLPNVVPPPQVEEHQLPVAEVSGDWRGCCASFVACSQALREISTIGFRSGAESGGLPAEEPTGQHFGSAGAG